MARILLIDDEPLARVGIARILWSLGHDVVEAESGRGALDLMRAIMFHVVITDINMPDLDGIELIMQLQAAPRPVPVIAISGGGVFPSNLLLENARFLGAVSTLAKPIDLTELATAVERALNPDAGVEHQYAV